MELLERAPQLEELSRLLKDASRGSGLLALVSGEAGIGKSVLVERFCRSHAAGAKVLIGHCESLSTPRPLAPLSDIALQAGGELARQLDREDRSSAFTAFLSFLRNSSRPTVVVLEDLHWADDATLDLLRFIARRLSGVRALLIGTFRDDEVGQLHPLRIVLGDLATGAALRRIPLLPFSEETVRNLAERRGLDGRELHRRTAGNPFFVTEVIASGFAGIPESVRDAILARVARLTPGARAALEAASVVGATAAPSLLIRLDEFSTESIEECMDSGLLQASGRLLAFRHELDREAVYDSLAPHRRVWLHGRVLATLRVEAEPDFAALAHHAEGAGDGPAVLAYARLAGQGAAELGSHREAAAQYRRAVRFSAGLSEPERAELLQLYAEEGMLTSGDGAIEALRSAVQLWRSAGDRLKEGAALSELTHALVMMGDNAAAERASRGAIELLERLPPGPELAVAYSGQAALRMLNRDNDEAIEWGQKSIALAEEFSHASALITSLNRVGSAMLMKGEERGRGLLERSMRLAREEGNDNLVAVAYSNLGSAAGELFEFQRAVGYLEEGSRYALERDLDANRLYMVSWLALCYLYLGRWDEATDAALEVIGQPATATISRIMALVALGRLRARRGDPDVWTVLDEALELAARTGTLQRLAPVHAARAEAAWFQGDIEGCGREATATFALALKHRHAWFTGELAFWKRQAGESVEPPEWTADPFALESAGAWQAAQRAWQGRGCPFEAARCLFASGEEDPMRRALLEFDRLGAQPAAAMVARRLRDLGARDLPRGPRPSTRNNPAQLTNREVEVLGLLSEGLSNRAIAGRLHISPRTVGHHVSAVLAKLEVGNRTEAVRAAVDRGMVSGSNER